MYQATIKLFRVCMMMAAVGLFLNAAPALAHHEPEPGHDPPPTTEVDCSSGFYKNHVSDWCDAGVCDPEIGLSTDPSCDDILADLEAKGKGGAARRMEAKETLDACFVVSPCEE